MTQATKLPFGTALALAQRALTAPLAAVLATEDLAMPAWFTLNALGLRGPSPIAVLEGLLATNGLDEAAVRNLLDGLGDSALVEEDDGVVSLTVDGTARYERLRDRLEIVASRIYENFGATRVEAARSLLQEIAESDPEQLMRESVHP